MEKVPTPLCTCLEKAEQTARHLMLECSMLSKERPKVLQNLPPPSDNEIPYKHSRRLQVLQSHLPHAAKSI